MSRKCWMSLKDFLYFLTFSFKKLKKNNCPKGFKIVVQISYPGFAIFTTLIGTDLLPFKLSAFHMAITAGTV